MHTRRKFVKTMAIGAAGVYAANSMFACVVEARRKLANIGYITGILGRNLGERDWQSMFKATAEYGYTEIETGNYLGDSAASFLSYCNEIGLKPIAGGMGFSDDPEKINEALDRLNSLELKYSISYWPWTGGAPFTLDDCKKSVEVLNKMGEMSKSRGLTFCWHNHDHEFVVMENGKTPFDYLMQHTDPALVKCELDIYWTQQGGADPVETLKKYKGRYPILHVKDMAPGEEQDFACPGDGIIDWPAVFSESADQGIKHYFVERDNAEDGLACLRSSAEYLLNLRF
jgi:sugar phosphate isomerase/epimerase